MPAKSKQQQKFMGIVRAIQQGDEPASKFSKSAQDAAEDMKEKDVEDFASTKHKGLPKKVEQYLRQQIRKSVEELLKKEDYVETCGYTQSVDGKKLKTPGGTGEEDRELKEAVTFRGAKGRSVVVPNEYVGKLGRVEHKLMKMLGYTGGKHNIIGDWNWGYNSRQKMKPNDEFSSSIILRSHPYIKGGRRELQKGDVKAVIVTLNKLLRASGLKIEKSKSIIYRPDRNNPMIEFRVEPRQFRESVEEERDYKAEYKKYGSSTKAKKYRAELNQYNRKNGTYGNGDGKDASHKGGKIVGFEKESTNRGRAEKSRLKKESVNERIMLKYNGRPITTFHFNAPVSKKITTSTRSWMVFDNMKDVKKTFKNHLDHIKKDKSSTKQDLETFKKMLKRIRVVKTESVDEAKRLTKGNRGVKVGDTVKFYDRDRNPAHYRGKVKWIMKAKKNKEFVDFIYITAKGNFTDQHLDGTKAYKWHYRRREGVNEARLDPKQLLQQLGGNRFIMMVGAKNLVVDKSKNELHMKIGRNSKGVSHVRIRLSSMDLYDMEFLQVRAGKIKIKSKEKGVYADQLGKMFKKNTGMNVRL